MPSELLTERRGAALVLTLSDPGTRNSLSPAACAAGIEAVCTAEADDEVRCLVLRGDGEHFCAGGNLQRLSAARHASPEGQQASMAAFHGWVEALRACPKPVIAAVEGWAAGGGASLALACDLVVAAEDARFVLSYGRLGLSPDGGATWALARALPRAAALRLLWLAEPMTARQWADLGLVSEVVERGHALPAALALADRLAAMAPNALASAKELLDAAGAAGLRAQLDAERDHFVRNLFHANGGEGLEAFAARRPPRFR
jgi:enoyl-CoA hydratase/carnithine racemase